jgi:hypothetical protein
MASWLTENTRRDQKLPRLIFYSAVGTLRDTQGQTVNQQFYLQVLKRLRLAVSRKRPQKRAAGAWALHHDSAPAHTAHSCRSATTLLPWHGSTWLLVVPPSKNSVEREEIWRLSQFRRIRRVRCTPFQKTLSKNVSCSGRTAGSSVSGHKESILKISKYFYPLAINCNFHSPSLGIFWSHLVMLEMRFFPGTFPIFSAFPLSLLQFVQALVG